MRIDLDQLVGGLRPKSVHLPIHYLGFPGPVKRSVKSAEAAQADRRRSRPPSPPRRPGAFGDAAVFACTRPLYLRVVPFMLGPRLFFRLNQHHGVQPEHVGSSLSSTLTMACRPGALRREPGENRRRVAGLSGLG
jgi:hypothetical protein